MPEGTTQLSYVHRPGTTPLVGETIDRFIRGVAARYPDGEAIVSVSQDERVVYADLDERVEHLARGLLAVGVDPGHRVGLWSTNNVEWIVLQLATARVGAVLVNIDPAYRLGELQYAIEAARIQTLFFIPAFRSSDYSGMLGELCPELTDCGPGELSSSRVPTLRQLVVFDPEDAPHTATDVRGFSTWPEVLERGRTITKERMREVAGRLDFDDPINIQFTSGTTGRPKPTLLTHHNLLNNAIATADVMRFTAEDRLCVPVPFFHCFGMVVSNLVCLTRGATIVTPAPHFEPGETLGTIERERCTAIHGVPSMFVAQLDHPTFADHDLFSLRTGIMAGAPCPPELMRRVIDDMHCPEILIGYGQTEASPLTHLTRPDDSFERRIDTVGSNLPHQETKVNDVRTGLPLPIGEQGEVCFRGYHVMRGYFGREDDQTVDEAGWLHSGDLGVMDAEGYLRVTGRIKEMIIRGGENIFPAEIEAFYNSHPKVAEVAVFGVPDPKLGEEVGAWIRLRPGQEADPEELATFARGKIAHYKVPRYIWLVDEFPMTATGKIQKFRIQEQVAETFQREGATRTGRLSGDRKPE